MKLKRICTSIALLLILFNCLQIAQEKGEEAASDKPLIFFLTQQYENTTAVNGGFAEFSMLAKSLGYRVDHGRWTEINENLLDGIDVLVMAIPELFLNDNDKVALKEFIRGGGGLLVIGYNANHFLWTDYANLSGFLKEFGIEYGASSVGDMYGTMISGVPLAGPNTVNRIKSPSKHIEVVVRDTGKAQMQAGLDNGHGLLAIGTSKGIIGKGKLVVHGNVAMFVKGQYSFIDYENNRELVANILLYFLGGYDLKMMSVKVKEKNLYPGDSVKVIVKIKNIGGADAGNFKISYVLSDDGSLLPASALLELKTLNYKKIIKAGKKVKITTTITIPTWIGSGDFYLVGVIDPDNQTHDADASNNAKAGKRFTIH
jgi:hypothetical protein